MLNSQLFTAAGTGELERLQAALGQHPTDVNTANRRGFAPLHLAAEGGHEACLQALLAAGASLEAKEGDTGGTALHLAVLDGREACVRALLTAGACLNSTDNDGWTPLHVAAYNGLEACLQLLLAAGADMEAADSGGRTALHLAALEEEACLAMLLGAGACVHAADDQGDSPLHKAAAAGKLSAIRRLLAAGANPAALNRQERTPAQVAGGDAAAVQSLLGLQAALPATRVAGVPASPPAEAYVHGSSLQLPAIAAAPVPGAEAGPAAAPDGLLPALQGLDLAPHLTATAEAAVATATAAPAIAFGPELHGRKIRVWWHERQEWLAGYVCEFFMSDRVHVVEFASVAQGMQLQRLRLQHERFQLLAADGRVQQQYDYGWQVQPELQKGPLEQPQPDLPARTRHQPDQLAG